MLILLTIFLFLLIPIGMVILHLVRPRFSIQGFLVVLAVLAGWPMVYLAQNAIPQSIPLMEWAPASIFQDSPSLLIDEISWLFSIALISLSAALIISSIAQLGISRKGKIVQATTADGETEITAAESPDAAVTQLAPTGVGAAFSWMSWAGILVVTSLGLLAVNAGNLLSMLLAWAALDFAELVILLGQVLDSRQRERIVLMFTARMAAIGVVLLAGIIQWSQGLTHSFETISQTTSVYLILAAGLRLGVLPLHFPLIQQMPLRRGLGTILRMIPAASSYILLARVAYVGVLGEATGLLLGLTALAGIYAAINWLSARDELDGRPSWLLGTASLAVASAILNQPLACLAWSVASLLSGGLILSMSIRHKNLLPIAALGLINLSALPFTPTWSGTLLYTYQGEQSSVLSQPVFYLLSFLFLLVHAILILGYYRHILRGMTPGGTTQVEIIERWVWLLYPIGLILISVSHYLTGFTIQPALGEVPLLSWIMGAVAVILAGAAGYLLRGRLAIAPRPVRAVQASAWVRLISLDWFYKLLWRIFRITARFISVLSAILEGDGGILWALVLFALIFVFLQR